MAEIKERKEVKATYDPRSTTKPAQEFLPETNWVAVAELLVDYKYQHRPYAKAIVDLNNNFRYEHSGYILVNVRQDGTIYIIDGQTRRAIFEMRGWRWIRAEILRDLTQAEEAEVYLIKCNNTQRMPIDYFLAEYIAQRPIAVLLHNLLAKHRIDIESYATASRKRGEDATPVVTCVTTLKRLLRHDEQGEVLDIALRLIGDTWDYSANALTSFFLEALHKMLMVHADELDRRSFVSKLSSHLPEELREQAGILRMGTNPRITIATAIQRVIIDLYNVGRREDRRITLGSPNSSPAL